MAGTPAAANAALTRFRRDHVGFVFQFYNLIPSLTALENVQLVTEIGPRPMDAAQALALLKQVRNIPGVNQADGRVVFDASLDVPGLDEPASARLVNNGVVSKQALDKAIMTDDTSRADWNAAKSHEQATMADVQAAKAALVSADLSGRHQVLLVAPVDGYILKIHERSERTVNAGTPLVTIGDPTRYEVVVDRCPPMR